MKQFLVILVLLLLFSACGTAAAATEPEAQTEQTTAAEPAFTFSTTDLEDNTWTEEIFADYSLTILNFWEPWCGPCVREMPDLEKISQDYADKGLLILGIYATPNMEAEVDLALESTGVTYPILHYTQAFAPLQTGYVPNTVVVDRSGAIVEGPFSGAMDYNAWAKLVEKYL